MSSDEKVRHVSTSIVRPVCHSDTTRRIDLTPWDLKMLPLKYMQRGLLYTDPKPKQVEKIKIISHLKTSFSHTLEHFFPLAGRLAITKHDDGTISVFINCNSTGAEFIHCAANTTVAYILDSTYVPNVVNSFFPLNGVVNHDGRSLPLLSVQVTELIDGIFIGCSMNHIVCDGTSFWHFLNSWSEISRGGSSDHISRPPILERWFLKDTDCPIRLPFSTFEHIVAERDIHSAPPPVEERIFHFKPESIARLKAKANAENDNSTTHSISSLQALFAYIWLAVTRARCLDPNEETSFWLAIGYRARLNPPLSEMYFGNSLLSGYATAKVGKLLERGFGWGASLLHQVVMSHNDAVIRSSWESWVDKPDFLFFNSSIPPKNTLMAGGSSRFNMYGNDFGWGQPVAVRSGVASKHDGKIRAIRGPVEGSLNIEVCLPVQMLKAMGDDPEFMEAVTP